MTDVAAERAHRQEREIADLYTGYPGFIIAAFLVLLELTVAKDPQAATLLEFIKKAPWPEGNFLSDIVALLKDVGRYVEARAETLSFIVLIAGNAYWYFCVYRIHSVLAAVTDGAYPISARRAVGLQLIPFFNLYWTFVWLKQLHKYIAAANVKIVSHYVLGLVILTGLVGGQFNAALGLVVIFSTLLYLRGKLQKVLPVPPPTLANPEGVALSAAIGCAFGALLLESVATFIGRFSEESAAGIKEIATIVVVSVMVVFLIEPLIERVRIRVGLSEVHAVRHIARPVFLRIVAILIIAFASLSDGLLHSYISEHFDDAMKIGAAAVVNFGITYAWARGVRRHPSRAAWLGLVSGGVIAVALAFALSRYGGLAGSLAENVHASGRGTQSPVFAMQSIDIGKDAMLAMVAWSLVGFTGGFVLDRGWGPRPSRTVAVAVLGSAVAIDAIVQGIAVFSWHQSFSLHSFSLWLAVSLGWVLGILLVGTSADAALRHVRHTAHGDAPLDAADGPA